LLGALLRPLLSGQPVRAQAGTRLSEVGRYALAATAPVLEQNQSAPAAVYVMDTRTGQVWKSSTVVSADGRQVKRIWTSLGSPAANGR
jgi:hypothetical protein